MVRPADKEFAKIRATISARMRELRKAKGLSQEALADEAGVHRIYVGMIERGQGNPSLLVITKLAGALVVDPPNLLVVS